MKVKDLDKGRPGYDPGRVAAFGKLYAGGDRFDPTEWLPQNPREDKDDYDVRMGLALYKNEAGPLVDFLTALLFSEPLRLQDAPEAWWSTWVDNVDRQRTSLSGYFSQAMTDANVSGAAYTFVDLPRRDVDEGPTLRGEEDRLGLRDAYLVPYTQEHVVSWDDDAEGRLKWVLFRDTITRSGELPEGDGLPEVEQVTRWTYIDGTVIRRWEAKEGDQNAKLVANVDHKRSRIPVARLRFPVGMHAMRQLRDPAVDLIRARNGHRWSGHRSNYAMWAAFLDGKIGDISGGPGTILKFPKDASIQHMTVDASSLEQSRKDAEDALDDLYRALGLLFQANHSDAQQQQSGASKAADWQRVEVSLAGYEPRMLDYAKEVVELVADARGEATVADAITVVGLSSWRQMDLDELLKTYTLARDIVAKSPTLQRLLAKRVGREALGDAYADNADVIEQELDDADWTPADPLTGMV